MAAPTIPDTMLAAQVTKFNKPYELRQVPVPKDLGPNNLLIKVAVASFCHTDFMVQRGAFETPLPCTGSHEGSGTVVAMGSDVSDFKIGDRVMAGIAYHPCWACDDCCHPEGYAQYCQKLEGHIGVNFDGFFAEYARIDATTSTKLPDQVSFTTAAPMACAGCTIYRGVLTAGLKKGEWLAIVGSGGGLGHVGIKFAKHFGLNVMGIDARDEGLALTNEAAADVVLDARLGQDHVVQSVQQLTSGKGADATINVSDAKTATALACAITKMHGTVVQLAAQPDEIAIPYHEFIFRDIRVRGSLTSSPDQLREMIDVVGRHGISVHSTVLHGLEKIGELVQLATSGALKGKGMIIVDRELVEMEKKAGELV